MFFIELLFLIIVLLKAFTAVITVSWVYILGFYVGLFIGRILFMFGFGFFILWLRGDL